MNETESVTCSQCGREIPSDEKFCGNCGHRADDSWIGEIIDGRYRILGRIGGGGMGEVYRIEHVRMGKIAAMKMIHGVLARDKEMRLRFRREAQAVSRLTHIHTVQVFDFGQHKESMYLVMEYVRGEDLGEVLRRDGPMKVFRACDIVVQVCGALAEAHEQGIIHRDVKPENLLLTRKRDGHDFVKVVDFGLARIRWEGEPSITAQGSVIGTPYYMAPEQAKGEEPDHRTDIYALGGVFYRAVTGQVPFAAPSPMVVLTKCLTEDLEPPSKRRPDLDIPEMVENVIMKAMAKDPEQRYATADEMTREVSRCLEMLSQPRFVSPVSALPPGLDEGRRKSDHPETWSTSLRLRREDFDHFERGLRRRRILQAMMIPLTLFILAGGLGYYFFSRRGEAKHAFHKVEKEPNNTTAKANRIGRGRKVKGTIGKRLSDTVSDMDIFSFTLPPGAWRVSAKLWPQRNMDLSMRLFDAKDITDDPVWTQQESGVGGAEAATSLVLEGGTYYMVVSEVVGPKGPTEGLSDCYYLQVDWQPLTKAHEQEPNDALEQAQQMAPSLKLRGTLNSTLDVDYYRFAVNEKFRRTGGRLRVELPEADRRDEVMVDCLAFVDGKDTTKRADPVRGGRAVKVMAVGVGKCNARIPAGVSQAAVKIAGKPTKTLELPAPQSPSDMINRYRLEIALTADGDRSPRAADPKE
jgi:serine/threonine-protein kinase